jgi:hypothetical protein
LSLIQVNQDGMSALYERGLIAMLLENTHVEEHSDFYAACNCRVCRIGTNHPCT